MSGNELVVLINKQLGADFNENISQQELQDKLFSFINDLIQNDFQRLVAILYKVDVDENKLKRILKEETDKDAAGIIAKLIIEREMDKVETRRKYKGKN